MISYLQAIALGLFQGVTELFPISSLGHSVILAWLFGWKGIVADETKSQSFFLSFLIALHVATAIALLIFYRQTWIRVIKGFFGSLAQRRIHNDDARLAWLLLAATVPAGLFGLIFEHSLRTQFAKPLSAIIFLMLNGCLLLLGDRAVARSQRRDVAGQQGMQHTTRNVATKLTLGRAIFIGVAQIGALFAGISRSGITMISGLYAGLSHEDAARFSFLLATPIILGAGLLKLPQFFADLDHAVIGQVLAGSVAAGIAAYVAVRFLDRYFQSRTLRPFALYCLGFGALMLMVGAVRGHF